MRFDPLREQPPCHIAPARRQECAATHPAAPAPARPTRCPFLTYADADRREKPNGPAEISSAPRVGPRGGRPDWSRHRQPPPPASALPMWGTRSKIPTRARAPAPCVCFGVQCVRRRTRSSPEKRSGERRRTRSEELRGPKPPDADGAGRRQAWVGKQGREGRDRPASRCTPGEPRPAAGCHRAMLSHTPWPNWSTVTAIPSLPAVRVFVRGGAAARSSHRRKKMLAIGRFFLAFSPSARVIRKWSKPRATTHDGRILARRAPPFALPPSRRPPRGRKPPISCGQSRLTAQHVVCKNEAAGDPSVCLRRSAGGLKD